MDATPGIVALHTRAARVLAVEVLLSEPEQLSEDALESLYLQREKDSCPEETTDRPMFDRLTADKLRKVRDAATLLHGTAAELGLSILADELGMLLADVAGELAGRDETAFGNLQP